MAKKKTRRKTKKNKAYTYKNINVAHRHGYTTKQYKQSITAKKRWDSLPKLQKEIILDNLKIGRLTRKRNIILKKEIQKTESIMQVELYKITSQSHYDARGKNYKTDFEYTTRGFFQNEPSLKKIKTMAKNSLISAFNSGKKGGGGYLKKSAFDKLVNGNLRGIEIQKVKVSMIELDIIKQMGNFNQLNAELSITNNGLKWIGRN